LHHIKEFSSGGSDKPSNLQALCLNCRADKTEHDRHKNKLKKIREKEARERNPFGTSNLFGSQSRKKMLSLNDALFGTIKKKKSKKDQFDFSF